MAEFESFIDRLKTACLDQAWETLGPPPDSVGAVGPRVEEAIGPYQSQREVLLSLVHRIVDAAAESLDKNQTRLAENMEDWLDMDLVRALGRPVEEVRAFIRTEAPRLIDLTRLARLLGDHQSFSVPERAVLPALDKPQILAGETGPFRELLNQLGQVANNSFSVLITGPTGTGKELIARRIHQMSPFAKGPFVPVDCAALPENLVEAELFGHEKGAFTGALRARPGKVELAAGGTLFLDEVAELPLSSQVKLFRFLQERVVVRLGGGRPTKVRVRVVASASRDLDQLISRGQFREELYYRLATLPLSVPPLKDRPQDLPPLIDHYLTEACLETGKVRRLSERVQELLLGYDYPGNVRELINLINHAVAVSRRNAIDLDDLPSAVLDRLLTGQPGSGDWLKVLGRVSLKSRVRQAVARLLAERAGDFITNADLRSVLNCSDSTAKTILSRLSQAGLVDPQGQRGGRRYLVRRQPEEGET
ncbi:MAG: sigma 54-interacting transcriptional regulator [Deltaproteobacteria bacterium]|nr:sigma 54-interacting transcriptional regulator [Deltaproteobacteria bacterium]